MDSQAQKRFALVTGGGSGIGRASAVALANSGWQVAVAGRREEALRETAHIGGPAILPMRADVARPDDIHSLFNRIQEEFGRLDLLFNNAGIGAPAAPAEDLSFEHWSAVLAINLTGTFLCCQEAIRMMKAQSPRGGRIINNGSISAHAPRPHAIAYTATKHAVTGITKTISLEGRAHDIACGQIDIGNAATELTERMAAGILQPNGTRMVEPRMHVDHAASAVVYMASLPLDANVQFMTVMATNMPFVGRG